MNPKAARLLRIVAPLEVGEYRIGVALFLRGLAAVYLVAIVSWWVQFAGLVGSGGLAPMAEYLDAVNNVFEADGSSRWLNLPTLFWLSSADGSVHFTLFCGVILALAALSGYAQGPAFLGLWVIYLSVLHTGGAFLSFQWDILLVEAGFVAVVAASWRKPWLRSGWKKVPQPPSRVAVFLLWFLLFRLMFFSGWVKLAWPDMAWWGEFDAMAYHYETQPLPTWTAWWMHQLPAGFQKFSLGPMYVVELVLPLCIFCGARLRLTAAIGIVGLMILIAATGNYTFFNSLTAILCLPLVADRFWKMLALRKIGLDVNREPPGGDSLVRPRYANAWRWAFAALLLTLSVLSIDSQLSTPSASRVRAPQRLLPDFAHRFHDSLRPFALVNGYGLFRTMTKERPEIVIEGTVDGGLTWQPYELKWKPGPLDLPPRFVAPHQPRLAWQFWFLALEVRGGRISEGNARWLDGLVKRLLAADESALAFFRDDPFDGKKPDAVQGRLYLYNFTNRQERAAEGNWWKREPVGVFFQRSRTDP